MAIPATPPTPSDPDSPTTVPGEPHDPRDAPRPPIDLHWRPTWRGDEPDDIDQLLTPH